MFGVLIILDARHKQAMEYPLMEKIHVIRAREGCKRRMTNDDELVRTVNETSNKAQLPKLVKSCACIRIEISHKFDTSVHTKVLGWPWGYWWPWKFIIADVS